MFSKPLHVGGLGEGGSLWVHDEHRELVAADPWLVPSDCSEGLEVFSIIILELLQV